MTSVPAAVLILGLFTSGLHAQLSLPAEFSGMLGQRGMMLDSGLLAGYELVPVIPTTWSTTSLCDQRAVGS